MSSTVPRSAAQVWLAESRYLFRQMPALLTHPLHPTLGAFLVLDGFYHWTTLNGILGAADNRASLVVYASPDVASYNRLDSSNLSQTYFVKAEQLDGMLFSFPEQGLVQYALHLHGKDYPVCFVSQLAREVPHVLCDNRGAIRNTVTKLIERGHRKIAFVQGPAGRVSASERLEGYLDALSHAGIALVPELLLTGGFSETQTKAEVSRLLTQNPPSAIVTYNDFGALGALAAVREAGIESPREIEIVGFDNIMGTRWTSPPLSTHHFDRFQMSYIATDELLRRIQGNPYQPSVRVNAELVSRGTTCDAHSREYSQTERSQSTFFCDIQYAQLIKDKEIKDRLIALENPKQSLGEFLDGLDYITTKIEQANGDVTILFRWLDNLTQRTDGLSVEQVHAAREAIVNRGFNQQLREREDTLWFTSVTGSLRELAFRATDETAVLLAFERVLRDLDVARTALYLAPQTAGEPGEWRPWDPAAKGFIRQPRSIPTAEFNLPELLSSDSPTSWFAMPLLYNEQSFGLVVLDARNKFLKHFPDLVRYFSAALHGSRTFIALTQLNKAHRAAQAAAEENAADLARSNQALSASQYFYHSLVESLPQGIVRKDRQGAYTYINSTFAGMMGCSASSIAGKSDEDFYPAGLAAKYRSEEHRVMDSRCPLEYEETRTGADGKKSFLHVKKIPLQDAAGSSIGIQVLYWDITSFRETEHLLKKAQQDLIEASRQAGIAEIATGVLHNIGNALNSVTTSATLIAEEARRFNISGIVKLDELIGGQPDLGAFFTSDPRSRSLPRYLHQLTTSFKTEQGRILEEAEALQENVKRVAQIVAAQQDHARVSEINVEMDPREIIECALTLTESDLKRCNISIVREYASSGTLYAVRHKVLQILTQLVKNGAEAMEFLSDPAKQLIVGFEHNEDGSIKIYVRDGGVGIAPENLARVFECGYTTKKSGHGFGLHSSANAAREMHGNLSVVSAGPAKGAQFTLTLPSMRPAAG